MNGEKTAYRELRPGDVRRVAELERLCNPMAWNEEGIGRFAAGRDSSGVRHAGRVAEIQPSGEIAGYACATLVEREAEIQIVGVAPQYRRQGIGKALMGMLLEDLRAWGCRSVFLEVRRENDTALSLYRGLGFEEAGIRKGYYEDNGEDARVMKLDLSRGRA